MYPYGIDRPITNLRPLGLKSQGVHVFPKSWTVALPGMLLQQWLPEMGHFYNLMFIGGAVLNHVSKTR